jgi:hypothetical protein
MAKSFVTCKKMFISRKRESGPDLFGSFAFGTGQDHRYNGADTERGHDDILAFRTRLDLRGESAL